MTKAQDRADAWVEFHKYLPEVVAYLKKQGVIKK